MNLFELLICMETQSPKIDFEKLIIYVTPLITLVGWGLTYWQQKSILAENRKHQKSDRELINFRERLSIIKGIISANLETTQQLVQLNILFSSGHFSFEEGNKILEELNSQATRLINLVFDPSFRSIQNLLPEEASTKIYEKIKIVSSKLSDFHFQASKIGDTNLIEHSILDDLGKRIKEITQQLINLSEFMTQEYSKLDIKLSKEE